MNGNPKKRGSAMHRAVDRLERFVEEGQSSVAIVLGIVLALLQLPGIQKVGEEIGLDSNRELLIAIGALLVTSILLELRQLKQRVTPAITGRQHYADHPKMYNALIERASELTDPDHFKIEVIGLTLYSAWPQLEPFLERPEVEGWTVRLATLAENGTAAPRWVPKNWPKESAATVAQVEVFRSRQGTDHDHKIEIYEYDFAPAVHGFRLGNGDVFISILRWHKDGRLGKHRFPYEYFPVHDLSPEADVARDLFKNWLERAVLSAKEPDWAGGGEGPSQSAKDETAS